MRFFGQKPRKDLPSGVGYVGIFLAVYVIYACLQTAPTFMDPDSFYHLKATLLMMERGLIRDFAWLPFTTLASAYTDHHLLYHLLLMPFITAFGPFIGMKVATVAFGAAAMTAFYAALRAYGSRWPAAFTLLLATSSAFMFRMNLAKTSSLSVALLMLALIAIRKNRPWALFFLSWAYVWLYGGWPIMGVVVAAFLVTRAVIDRLLDEHPLHSWGATWFWRRLFRGSRGAAADFLSASETRHALAAGGGLLAGLVVNPYFPKNLLFYWEQIVQIAVIGYKGKIGVGVEWYPYANGRFYAESSSIFLAIAVCLTLLIAMVFWNDIIRRGTGTVSRQEISAQIAAMVLASVFFILTLRSRRHIEYFAPFATLTVALFFTMLTVRLDVKALIGRVRALFPAPPHMHLVFFTYIAFLFVALGVRDVLATKETNSGGIPWTRYAAASAWLKENAPDDAVIFHSDWDDFPLLFLHDDRHRYIAGLDPTFLYRKDPERYWAWADISAGRTKENVAKTAKDLFGASYVFVEHDHKDMRDAADADPALRRVYQDDEVRIYEVH